MLPGRNRFSAPVVTSEGPFPLGPFPRHIWIHSNTPQDSLDEACHNIWKRVQQLSEELQPPSLVPPLQHALCSDLPGTLRRDNIDPQSQVNAGRGKPEKSRITSEAHRVAYSAKSPSSSKGLEEGSVTGAHSMVDSKADVPFLLKYNDTAKGAGNQAMAEETKVVKEFAQNSMFSSAKSSTAVSSAVTAESQATGQMQQFRPFAKICSKADSDAVTKNPVTTATSDKKNIKYNASTSGFSTTSVTTALNQPVWQSLSFPPLPFFPNHSNFPQSQGLYPQRAEIPYQQALHHSFGCYSSQVAPYTPQQIFQPPYAPTLNYIALVQPGYPYPQRTPPTLSSSIQDLSPMAGDGIQYPFSPSYGFSSTPGGAVTTNFNYFSSESYVKF
ncbi:uncharacterized protein C1orf94 homolog [Morus bassanus]